MQHFFNISKSQNSKNIQVQLEVFFKIHQLFVVAEMTIIQFLEIVLSLENQKLK